MDAKAHKKHKSVLKKKRRKNAPERYDIEKSPLWRISSIHNLAKLLNLTPERLMELSQKSTYRRFVEESEGKKPRNIQEPVGATLNLHSRLLMLLDRIKRPSFLHSATRKRSFFSNASAHVNDGPVVKTDIRRFYEATSYHHVKQFFHDDLGWAHDIAKIVAKICTVDDHLPTGSCLSPLLSYFVHRLTFEKIRIICDRDNVRMTLYVDDVTLSGALATKKLLYEVKALLGTRGLYSHKEEFYAPNSVAVITGVAVSANGTHLRNGQHKDIYDSIANLDKSKPISSVLMGKISAAGNVDPHAAAKFRSAISKK